MSRRRLIGVVIVGATAALTTLALGTPARGRGHGRPVIAQAGSDGSGSGTDTPLAVIDIVPMTVDILGPGMVPVAITYAGSAGHRMTALDINGDTANVFTIVDCNSDHCTFIAPDRALPTSVDIACSPDTIPHTATLVATGDGGATDTDMATLSCYAGSAGGPTLQITPNPVTMPATAVGTTAMMPMTMTNGGSGTLSAQLAFPSAEWTADGCVAAPCTMTGFGSATTVNVLFTPSTYGNRSSTIAVTNNGPVDPTTVNLVGSGSGATLDVTAPPAPAYEIDFGTIPRGSAPQRPLTMVTAGNVEVTVDLTPPTVPFSLGATQLVLQPGIPGSTSVTCTSATAGGPFVQTIPFTSNAYEATTSSIGVRCSVADTILEVAPTPFDFGEVRVGGAPVELPFTLHDPSATEALVVHAMHVSSAAPGLALDAPITSDTTLAPGETRAATLRLTPTEEVDLAGRTLDIAVDAANLAFPITGKVVTPRAHVVPDELDLGTACVGSEITGQVLLVNDGTATLAVQRPTTTAAFTPVFQDPADYPAPLRAGRTAMLGVQPSATTTGAVEGTLSWEADAPGSPFSVPLRVEYVADGAAISPQRVPFGVVPVETRSEKKWVKLENCGATPLTLALGGVTSRAGGTKVWDVQPSRGTIVMPAFGVQMLSVEFAPLRRGSYAATIELTIDGVAHPIEIFGDASGPLLAPTSFYACDCAAGAPLGGWPCVLALVIVTRRRRRGSSSAR